MADKIDMQHLSFNDDVQQLCTKKDLEKLATKEELQNLATKNNLKNLATKTDVSKLPSMCDLDKLATHHEISELDEKAQMIGESMSEVLMSMMHVARGANVQEVSVTTHRVAENVVELKKGLVEVTKSVKSVEGDIDAIRHQIGKSFSTF